jgi:hypothetical protein
MLFRPELNNAELQYKVSSRSRCGWLRGSHGVGMLHRRLGGMTLVQPVKTLVQQPFLVLTQAENGVYREGGNSRALGGILSADGEFW